MAPSLASPRPIYVHIGASKTGTSAVQRSLWSSVEPLAAAGVGLPLVRRPANIVQLLRPLGWVTGSGFVKPIRPRAVERLGPLFAHTAGDRLVVSNEDLAEAGPRQIDALVTTARSSGLEVHAILTLRDLAAIIPSEWQQFLKHRLTTSYPQFLEEVRDRQGRWAAHFWQRQDAVAIAERWATFVGVDRMHVIVVPPLTADPDGIFRMFAEVVGFQSHLMRVRASDVNASLGYVEAEVHRRLNVALGDRLPHFETQYHPAVRRVLAQGVLARGASERITLPPEHVSWVQEEAERLRSGLLAAGYPLHGDSDRLVPAADVGRPLPVLDEAAVARAAIDTLANFAVFTSRQQTQQPPREPSRSQPDGRAGTSVTRRGNGMRLALKPPALDVVRKSLRR